MFLSIASNTGKSRAFVGGASHDYKEYELTEIAAFTRNIFRDETTPHAETLEKSRVFVIFMPEIYARSLWHRF